MTPCRALPSPLALLRKPRLCAALRGVLAAAGLAVALAMALGLGLAGAPAHAAGELQRLDVTRGDAGVLLDYDVRFELSNAVEDALTKGVPLHFEVDAQVWRSRWYWRDKRVGGATRAWRIAFQPLTGSYRLSLGSTSQTYGSLAEALRVIQRGVQWRIADPIAADDPARHYVEFSFRLDTNQLPRPLQIDVAGRADWDLRLERSLAVPAPR